MDKKTSKLKMPQLRVIVKYVGNIVTVISVIFIIYRLTQMNLSESISFTPQVILSVIILSVVYGLLIVVYCLPWRAYIRLLSGKKTPFVTTSYIMSKSNIMKYVPGNVFQYIGRNELAVRENIPHKEVAFATVLDVASSIIAVLITGVVCFGGGIQLIFEKYRESFIIIAILILVVLIAAVCFTIFNKGVQSFVKKILALSKIDTLKTFAFAFVFYVVNMLLNTVMFLAVLTSVMGMTFNLSEAGLLAGSYILAWLAGFLLPGAPGGIGVREAVFALLLSSVFNVNQVLTGIVVYRLISIIGDVLGYLFTIIMVRISDRRNHSGNKEAKQESAI